MMDRIQGATSGGGHSAYKSKGMSQTALIQLHHKLFKKLDHNHDKRLSLDEMKDSHILQKLGVVKTDEEVKSQFDKIDLDHDGTLTEKESMFFFVNLMASKPSAAAMVTMMMAAEDNKPDSPEEVAAARNEANLETNDPLDPDQDDKMRHQLKALKQEPGYNEGLLAYAKQALEAKLIESKAREIEISKATA